VLVLLRQALLFLLHRAAPPLILGQRHHPAQVRLRQPLQLLVEARRSFVQQFPAGLQLLR